MITVFVKGLSQEKVNAIRDAITLNGGNLVETEDTSSISFECKDCQIKRQICKAITKAKN